MAPLACVIVFTVCALDISAVVNTANRVLNIFFIRVCVIIIKGAGF